MPELYSAVVLLNPVSKKNSQQILINRKTGRPFISPSKAYKTFEKDCLSQLPKPEKPISSPVNVMCVYYMATKRKVDLCNLIEATCDILVRAGVLEDDNSGIVVSHDGSRVLYDKQYARTEVTITEAENDRATD
jgi:Holliday junction resolvase RusA-like endonuclease